jgi:hypothetical protein
MERFAVLQATRRALCLRNHLIPHVRFTFELIIRKHRLYFLTKDTVVHPVYACRCYVTTTVSENERLWRLRNPGLKYFVKRQARSSLSSGAEATFHGR